MLHLRRALHPIRSARSLYHRVSMHIYRRVYEPQFRKIRRGVRDRCWCGGELLPFKWHPSYGVCANCGCYVNRRPPLCEELQKVYSFDLYWHTRQRLKGHPPIETRAALYRSDGRLDFWLRLIQRYGPSRGRIIEVGCAPGVLLAELQKRGYECVGVEVDNNVAEWMRRNLNLDVRVGLFPDVELPSCELFLSFDVLEHSWCPETFMREASRLLCTRGIVIVQTAIDLCKYERPFGERFDIFDDIEHTFLFTDRAMKELARRTGLDILSLEDGLWPAGEVCILRKLE